MINITTALFILFIHWLADFHHQNEMMAMNKAKSNFWLTAHVLVYTFVTLLFWHFYLFQPLSNYNPLVYLEFFTYIFTTHWITDYITSRLTGKLYLEGKYHDFFVMIGFDQLLHAIQLYSAYYLFIE